MIFEGDNHEQVVNNFSEIYKLGPEKHQKLMEIVKSQMRNVLQNIGEAEDEEESTTHNTEP